MTSALRRLHLRGAALATRRRLVVVLVHADRAQARDGQRRRGRWLSERRMRRHEGRYGSLLSWAARHAVVLDRGTAARATDLHELLPLHRPGHVASR